MTDVHEMLKVVETTWHEDEPYTPNDLGLDDLTDPVEAVIVWGNADRQLQAARKVRDTVGQVVATLLGEGGAAALGDTIVRYQRGWDERCTDPEGFDQYMTGEIVAGEMTVGDLVNPNDVKRSALTEAARSTFYQRDRKPEPSITTMPRHKAPKFLQGLESGSVIVK